MTYCCLYEVAALLSVLSQAWFTVDALKALQATPLLSFKPSKIPTPKFTKAGRRRAFLFCHRRSHTLSAVGSRANERTHTPTSRQKKTCKNKNINFFKSVKFCLESNTWSSLISRNDFPIPGSYGKGTT